MKDKEIKAIKASEIIGATNIADPIDETSKFFVDFSKLRTDFSEKIIYKSLGISTQDNQCTPLITPARIFLSGHRGTGKTSQLLKLKNDFSKTNCFLCVFCDVSEESLDLDNIDFVDIVLFMLEKLLEELDNKNIKISEDVIDSLYSWYATTIKIIEDKSGYSFDASQETEVKTVIPLFFKLASKVRIAITNKSETRNTIRQEFNNKYSDFCLKFNQFIIEVKEALKEKDILFIVDGFEKIGTFEDTKKILIDNSNKFVRIKTNLIITPPIELFYEIQKKDNLSTPMFFPLIKNSKESIEKFKDFIDKRIARNLFESDEIIENIIVLSGGSPREILRIIQNAYLHSETDIIDKESVQTAKRLLSNQIIDSLNKKELLVIGQIKEKNRVPASSELNQLLAKKAVLDYGNGTGKIINPLIEDVDKLQELLSLAND